MDKVNLKDAMVYPEIYVVPEQNKPFNKDDIPLAFMCHYEDNAAFKKRKENMDTWGSTYDLTTGTQNKAEGAVFPNNQLEGFKIAGIISRWQTSNKLATIYDPRGFYIQIYMDNVEELIANTTIINGIIQGKCVWGRDAAKNVLLHESMPSFNKAAENKEKRKQVTNLKESDLKLGDIIEYLQTGEYIYLGKLDIKWTHNVWRCNYNYTSYKYTRLDDKPYATKDRELNGVYLLKQVIDDYNYFKIVKSLPKAAKTGKHVEVDLNDIKAIFEDVSQNISVDSSIKEPLPQKGNINVLGGFSDINFVRKNGEWYFVEVNDMVLTTL